MRSYAFESFSRLDIYGLPILSAEGLWFGVANAPAESRGVS